MKSKENQGDNNETKKIDFEDFVNLYPSINEIKNFKKENDKGSLAFLKEFYVKVWGSYEEYVENDLKLYNLFDHSNDGCNFIFDARIALLDNMYGTQIKAIRKIIDVFLDKKLNGCNDIISEFKKIKSSQKSLDIQFNVRNETSFASKYFHWLNEVNKKEPTPIYDNNVRNLLKFYNSPSKSIDNLEALKTNIDNFIKDKLELEFNNNKIIADWKYKKINNFNLPAHDNLYNNISIYRLVDKFLWLSYKIVEQLLKPKKTNTLGSIPIDVTISYLELLAKVKNKEKKISELINNIKNLTQEPTTETSQNKLKKERNQKIKNIKKELQEILKQLNPHKTQQSIAKIDETPATQLQKTLEL